MIKEIDMQQCPCGSSKDYAQCCEPYLSGQQLPASPEAMMRSRYTAFTLGDMDYIEKTIKGHAADVFDKTLSQEWVNQVQWKSLKIINSSQPSKSIGFVEFVAHYQENGQDQYLHEQSEFHLENGIWYYVNGRVGSTARTPAQSTKVGRNEPCPCGSGKKYKKCCGQ